MKAIVNTKLILEDGILWDGAITFENGRILEVGARDKVNIPEGTDILDAGGLYTAPGLIDIHNHGMPTELFHRKPMECARYFLAHGETTILPTFYCDMTLEQMIEGAQRVREASKTGAGKVMDGLYMEGPYMSGIGSNQKYIKWTGDIDPGEYMPMLEGIEDIVRVWAIDPSRKGIEGFMKDVRARKPEAIFAFGHSHATFEDCKRVAHLGVKVQTHHGDSGQSKGRAQGTPGAGCDTYTLYHPEMYAELICDQNGVHVVPDLLKNVVRTKGVERVVLITDSMASKENFPNNEADGIFYGPDLNYDYRGWLAGSRLTLENAVRNMMTHTGYGLCHAIRMATLNPATLLGIDREVGSLEAGKKANLILIDDMVHVKKVWLEGELAAEDGEVVI